MHTHISKKLDDYHLLQMNPSFKHLYLYLYIYIYIYKIESKN